MDVLIVAGMLLISALLLSNAILRARLEGIREAQRQQQMVENGNQNSSTMLRFLAVIGLLTLFALCFYVGMTVSALAN